MTTRKINDIFIGRPPEATVPLPDAARGSETDRERQREKNRSHLPLGIPSKPDGRGVGAEGNRKNF